MDVDSKSKWLDKKNDDNVDKCSQQSEKCENTIEFLLQYIKYHQQCSSEYTRILLCTQTAFII